MKATLVLLALLMFQVLLTGCVHVKTDPIRIEPIEITMNVNLRIAKELDSFFADLDAQSAVMEAPSPAPN